MNIDDYLAMQEEEAKGAEPNVQEEHQTTPSVEQAIQEAPEVSTPVQQEPIEQAPEQTEQPIQTQETQEHVDYEAYQKALQEAENLRNQAQALYKQNQQAQIAKQYYDKMMADPGYAKVFAENNGLPFVDPAEQRIREIEQNYNDLLLQREIENMQIKYKDFDPVQVIQLAVDKNINNLEDAYLLSKAKTEAPSETPDVNSLKEQIRQEILNELQSQVDTGSLIGTSGGGAKKVTDNTPQLTEAEKRVALNMKLTPEQYAKWRDKK